MAAKIGLRIKDKRLELDMTLADLGAKAGVGASTVRKWETGYIKDMRSDKVQKVADALGVTPAYLMGWNEEDIPYLEPTPVKPVEEKLSKEEIELLRIYRELNVKGRMKLLSTAMDLETEHI